MNIINGVICYLVVERVMGVLNGEGRQALTAYNVVTNNCEHFVSWARNGWALSHQVKNITEKCLSVSLSLMSLPRFSSFLYCQPQPFGLHLISLLFVKVSGHIKIKYFCRGSPISTRLYILLNNVYLFI